MVGVRGGLAARSVPASGEAEGHERAERIGLIAGSGRFPVVFADAARRRGVERRGGRPPRRDRPELDVAVHAITWVQPGQLAGASSTRSGVRRVARRHGRRHREAAALPRVHARRARPRRHRADRRAAPRRRPAARPRRRARDRRHPDRPVDDLSARHRPDRRRARPPARPTAAGVGRHPLRLPGRQGDRAVRHRPERRGRAAARSWPWKASRAPTRRSAARARW